MLQDTTQLPQTCNLYLELMDFRRLQSVIKSALQAGFRSQLKREVAAFVVDAREFRADWTANGPMVPNLAPADAVVRLKLFQQTFEANCATKL